jgi:hypothetical protein
MRQLSKPSNNDCADVIAQDESEAVEAVQAAEANVKLDQEFYKNNEQSFDDYFLADSVRNG